MCGLWSAEIEGGGGIKEKRTADEKNWTENAISFGIFHMYIEYYYLLFSILWITWKRYTLYLQMHNVHTHKTPLLFIRFSIHNKRTSKEIHHKKWMKWRNEIYINRKKKICERNIIIWTVCDAVQCIPRDEWLDYSTINYSARVEKDNANQCSVMRNHQHCIQCSMFNVQHPIVSVIEHREFQCGFCSSFFISSPLSHPAIHLHSFQSGFLFIFDAFVSFVQSMHTNVQ